MRKEFLNEEIYQNLPEFVRTLTAPYLERERDIVLLSSLGVLSACLPNVYGVYNSENYTPHFYLLIIAPPASGKGVMGKSKKLIDKIHQQIKQASEIHIAECKEGQKVTKNKTSKCPELEVKLAPGNVSSSKIYKHIQNSPFGLLIFETEADTISTMLKQDWGNFSDVLRKAFHHETISISRDIDDKYFEIEAPKLSLVISGTPSQVAPLINSKENGLFSRFLFYYFNEPSFWKDVSPEGESMDTNLLFSKGGDEILSLHNKLMQLENEIEVCLTKEQWGKLNVQLGLAYKSLVEINKTDVLPTIKRNGVILFRICMILTLIRNKDNIDNCVRLYCEDADFNAAMTIVKNAINHSIVVANLLGDIDLDPKKELNMRESIFLAKLSINFNKQNAIEIGKTMNIPSRSIDYILAKLLKLEIIQKLSNGVYMKKDNIKPQDSQELQDSQIIYNNLKNEPTDVNKYKDSSKEQANEGLDISNSSSDN